MPILRTIHGGEDTQSDIQRGFSVLLEAVAAEITSSG